MAHDGNMVRVKVEQLVVANQNFAVLLKSPDDQRAVPIFIGSAEAQAIALWLNKVEVPRPLTHDLIRNMLESFDAELLRVEVTDLREGTFYARLILTQSGIISTVDARPSDAIALALRCRAGIYLSRDVLESAGVVFQEQESETDKEPDPPPEPKQRKKRSPLQILQRNLDRAIEDERYEDAAQLRDEISRLEKAHGHN